MLVEIHEVRDEVGGDPSQDARLLRLLRAIESQWEQKTARLWTRRENLVLPLRPKPYAKSVWSTLYPIQTIQVREWADGDSEADAVLLTAGEDYRVGAESGQIERLLPSSVALGCRPRAWADNVKLTVTGGYTSDTCPAQVKEAIITQLKYKLARDSGDKIDLVSAGGKHSSANYLKDELHPDFVAAIRSLRRMVTA